MTYGVTLVFPGIDTEISQNSVIDVGDPFYSKTTVNDELKRDRK
jgi:hypothetical protein